MYLSKQLIRREKLIISCSGRAKASRLLHAAEHGMTGATGNIYGGLAEFEEMGFLLHFLRQADFFVDVGANVGAFTVLAGKVVGADCLAIEALPATYLKLLRNVAINFITPKVEPGNYALGEDKGALRFTSALDTMNHIVPVQDLHDENVCSVPVKRLDDVLSGRVPKLIKIDVEGYETPVMCGASATLASSEQYALIMELNGCGQRYGYDDMELHQTLLGYGYSPVSYDPLSREIKQLNKPNKTGNTIYIKVAKFDYILRQLQEAKAFNVKGQDI